MATFQGRCGMAYDKRSRGRGEEAGYISNKNGYCGKRDRSTTMTEEVIVSHKPHHCNLVNLG